MHPLTDVSSPLHGMEQADVIMHLSTAPIAAVSQPQQQQQGQQNSVQAPQQQQQQEPQQQAQERQVQPVQQIRTYHLHASLLRTQSAYFEARLSSNWQRELQAQTPGAESASAGSAASQRVRHELVEHVEADELDAMEQLLRMMYSQQVPAAATPPQLLRVLRLADRYQATVCSELLLTHLASLGKQAVDANTLAGFLRLPEGLHSFPAHSLLIRNCFGSMEDFTIRVFSRRPPCTDAFVLGACKQLIACRYGNVPCIISTIEFGQKFYALPFAAVLAWASSDELQVHSENCVLFLLAAWVVANTASSRNISAQQLKQLAQQVRVLHLGPAYQFFVLNNLDWFRGCSGTPHHLPQLLAFKGLTAEGVPVYPARNRGLADSDSWRWTGPAAWVAGPRQGRSCSTAEGAPQSDLSWELSDVELQQLCDGSGKQVCSPLMHINGFLIQASAQSNVQEGAVPQAGAIKLQQERQQEQEQEQQQGTVTLGMNLHIRMLHNLGPPTWSDAAATAVRHAEFSIRGPAGAAGAPQSSRKTLEDFQLSLNGRGWGHHDILGHAAPTMRELLAPLLVDGKLLVEVTVSGVDLPA